METVLNVASIIAIVIMVFVLIGVLTSIITEFFKSRFLNVTGALSGNRISIIKDNVAMITGLPKCKKYPNGGTLISFENQNALGTKSAVCSESYVSVMKQLK